MSNQTNTNATQFGTIAQNIAPYGVMMAIFALVYAACFGLCLGLGWLDAARASMCSGVDYSGA